MIFGGWLVGGQGRSKDQIFDLRDRFAHLTEPKEPIGSGEANAPSPTSRVKCCAG